VGCESVIKRRSTPHNAFYHALLRDIHQKALQEHLTVENMDFLKQGLKKLDGIEKSTALLTDKELVHHIEFIIKFLGQYGICPTFVETEWERIKQTARK